MFEHRKYSSRTTTIAVLLSAAMAVVGLLTFHAHYVNVTHRKLAEEVLRDYASLAADEALRRIAAGVGYYGYRVVMQALQTREHQVGRTPRKEELLAGADPTLERSLELVERTFLFDLGTKTMTTSSAEPEVDRTLTDLLSRTTLPTTGAFQTAEQVIDSRHFVWVFAPAESNRSQIIGFQVDTAALGRWCAFAIERAPLLPQSLANRVLDSQTLYLQIRGSEALGSRELYSSAGRYVPNLVVERSLPDDYESIADGLVARAAIHPEAASKLIIGGLPSSKLPTLLSLAGLTAGLLVAAVALLRRERALSRLRTDFVSRVSHELRTPLAQIRMFTETLRLGRVRSDAERQRSLEIMDRESRRLSALVENILQFSRAERDSTRLVPRVLDLLPFCQRLLREFESTFAENTATLELDIEPGLQLEADEDAVRQTLLNLLDNAIKYGPENQRILLAARERDDMTILWVEDEGRGIPEKASKDVWLPFFRVEQSNAPVSGTGIGLAVVHDLVVQHGGRCRLEHRAHRGVRVLVEFPTQFRGNRAS